METAQEDATAPLLSLDKAASQKLRSRSQQESKSRQRDGPYANKVQSSSQVSPISVGSSSKEHHCPAVHGTALG